MRAMYSRNSPLRYLNSSSLIQTAPEQCHRMLGAPSSSHSAIFKPS
jgi:hypothetical protein